MRVDVCFTPAELAGYELAERTAVVIDALRATSTITVALANGARSVYPARSSEDAVRLKTNLGRDGALLCGERGCLKPDGFDLGNSPREYSEEAISGRFLALSTTNGTLALQSAGAAKETLVGSFLNLGALAEALAGVEEVLIVCSGRENRFALEDAVCAGMLVERLASAEEGVEIGDAAEAALLLAGSLADDLPRFLASTEAGRQLVALDLGQDIEFCARVDAFPVVPRVRDRQVVLG